MFVCSLRYPSCNSHALYCQLWLLGLYGIFSHYLINGTIFEKKITEHKMRVLIFSITFFFVLNFSHSRKNYPLRTVRPIYRTGVPLPSRCCILCFFSTNISIEYFKHAAHSLFFSSKCRLFLNATFLGSCIIHILHTVCDKI
jgi:hypothetical protein